MEGICTRQEMFLHLCAFLSSVIVRVLIPDRRAPRQFQTALGISYILVGQSDGGDLYTEVLISDRKDSDGGDLHMAKCS